MGLAMYHSILVPLDGSQFAEQALPPALSIANRAGATLEVVQVHVLYAFQEPACSWSPFDPTEDALFKEHEQAYLDAVVRRLEKTASVPVTSALMGGLIVDGILERARTKPADLIVMTTHGRGRISRFWLGSVAVELVRHGPTPILLVRPQENSTDRPPEPTFRRILDTAGRIGAGRTSAGTGYRVGKSRGRRVHAHSGRGTESDSGWLSHGGGTECDRATSA